jgi:hypothetical protein
MQLGRAGSFGGLYSPGIFQRAAGWLVYSRPCGLVQKLQMPSWLRLTCQPAWCLRRWSRRHFDPRFSALVLPCRYGTTTRQVGQCTQTGRDRIRQTAAGGLDLDVRRVSAVLAKPAHRRLKISYHPGNVTAWTYICLHLARTVGQHRGSVVKVRVRALDATCRSPWAPPRRPRRRLVVAPAPG